LNQGLLSGLNSPPFGMPGALCQGMMPTLIENIEREPRPYRTREEASRILEELWAAYQGVGAEIRGQIKNHLSKLARVQSTIEGN